MGDLARSNGGSNTSRELIRAACERIALPALALLVPGVGVVAALYAAGRDFADTVEAQGLAAEIEGLRHALDSIEARVRRGHSCSAEQFRSFVQHPATLKLLATARDDWAVAQMRPQLERLAAVVAGRAPRPNDDLDRDLRFARAAMAVPSIGVEFLAMLSDRAAKAPPRIEHGMLRITRPNDLMPGACFVGAFVRGRTWARPEDLSLLVAAIFEAQAQGLVQDAGPDTESTVSRYPQSGEAKCVNGATGSYSSQRWAITTLGTQFVQLVRDAKPPHSA